MVRRLVLSLALVVSACGGAPKPAATPTPTPTSVKTAAPTATAAATPKTPARETIATGLHVPWGIAFLPNGDALVAERTTGRILRIHGHTKSVAMQVPGVATNAGEGGLLGLAYRDSWVYAYFTTSSDNRIVRFKLGGKLHVLVSGIKRGVIHNGGRIAFGPDGKLYAGVGETGETGLAQQRDSLNGKILRINPDGSIPKGNPFGTRIWSWGHRNVQGLAWDKAGHLWESEFGQDTWDEVNLIRPGRNYGWPVVEGKGDTHGGTYTNPLVVWPTSEASPSGDAIIGSTLYVAALRGQAVWRIPIHGATLGTPTRILTGYGRIRTVVKAPDGRLWIATSNTDGRGSPRAGDDRIVSVRVSG